MEVVGSLTQPLLQSLPSPTVIGYILQKNFWTYILLDSFTGKIWQTQFTVDENGSRFSIPINETILSYTEYSKFEVKPMVSMFQFYLINKDTGEMWQFQWSTNSDDGYRWIKK